MSTPAQALASRANGALSHGPVSESGKAISSRNALKTGLTGRTVLLPSEVAALFEVLIHRFRERYSPVGDEELALFQSLADPEWRLQLASPVSKWVSTLWAGWNSPMCSPIKTNGPHPPDRGQNLPRLQKGPEQSQSSGGTPPPAEGKGWSQAEGSPSAPPTAG